MKHVLVLLALRLLRVLGLTAIGIVFFLATAILHEEWRYDHAKVSAVYFEQRR